MFFGDVDYARDTVVFILLVAIFVEEIHISTWTSTASLAPLSEKKNQNKGIDYLVEIGKFHLSKKRYHGNIMGEKNKKLKTNKTTYDRGGWVEQETEEWYGREKTLVKKNPNEAGRNECWLVWVKKKIHPGDRREFWYKLNWNQD